MFLALSVALVGVVASQIAQNRSEDSARQAHIGLGSAIAIAAEQIGPSARALVNLPTIEPSAWTALGNDTNNSFYHWWVSSSSNSVLVPSNIPTGSWASVTYGNNIWVAVNTAGTAFTSPDGLTWTQRNALPNAGTLNYTNLTYGLGSFIATASTTATNIATSPDGITWTSITIPSGTYIPSCSTTTCVFLSTTSASGYYSTNLTSFNAMVAVPFIAKAVTFAISSFVMSGNNAIATSLDGSTWTSRTVSARNWGLVGSVNGVYVAADVQASGSTAIVTSTDGITWTDRVLPQPGNWVAIATAGPQIGLFSGPIASINQSSYLGSSNTTSWVSNPLPAGAPWTAASGNYKSFFVMQSTNPSYLIPVSGSVSSSQTLTVTTRLQQGRLTNANNGQYYASIVYTWNVAGKKWLASKYVGPSTPGLSLVPNAPTGVVGNRTAPGVINVSWIPPSNSGSSAVTSYLATASPGGYYCPSGGQLSGTTCTTTSTSVASHTAITYKCTTGDTPSGTQFSAFTCTNTTTYAANYTASTYRCNSGDTPSGIQATAVSCTHTTTYGANYQATTYKCTSGDTPTGTNTSTFTCTNTVAATYNPATYTCTSGDTPSGIQGSQFTCTQTILTTYSAPVLLAGAYNCTSPAVLSGTNCVTTTAAPAACASGYTAWLDPAPNSVLTCYELLGGGLTSHDYWNCPLGYTTIPTATGGWLTSSTTYQVTDDPLGYWSPGGVPGGNGGHDAYANRTCVGNNTNYISPNSRNPTSGQILSVICPNSGGYTSTAVPILWGDDPQMANFAASQTPPILQNKYYSMCSQTTYPATVSATTYQCPSGGTATYNSGSGTWYCYAAATSVPATATTSTITYSCNAGDSLSVSTCTITYTNYNATATTGCAAGTGTLTYNSSSSTYTCVLAGTTYYSSSPCVRPNFSTGSPGYIGSNFYYPCQHPPTSNGTIRIYSCSGTDTLSGTNCIPNPSSGTYPATSSGGTTTYSCPSGTPVGSGSTMTCTTSAGLNYLATVVAGTTSCSGSDTLSGSICIIVGGGLMTNGFANNDWCGGTPSASLDPYPNYPYITASKPNTISGPNGIGCYNTNSPGYVCTSPDVLSGSNCVTTIAAPFAATTYQCTSGDSPSGVQSSAVTCINTATNTYPSPGTAAYYSCSSGTLSGSNCLITYTSPVYVPAYYYCTSGDTPVSTSPTTFTCTNTTTYPAPVLIAAYYSCNAGDTPATTSSTTFTCTDTTTYLSSGTAAFYSCSSGILSGNLCLTTVTSTATYNSGGYTCSSGTQTNCTISGMTNGVYTFTVTAANNAGTSVASIASALVAPQLLALSYPSTVFSTGQISQVLTPVVTGSSGASITYSESGALPSGVTFNTSTGALTGPSGWGSVLGYPFTITVTATDSLTGYTISAPVTFTLVTP